jgi:hypothetical protein
MATRLSQDERRTVALSIFAALCSRYPKHYIALIESKAPASSSEPVPSAAVAAVEGPDASVGGEADARPT